MCHKYTSLILLIIQYDYMPKAAGGVHIWAITSQKKYYKNFVQKRKLIILQEYRN